MKFISTRGSGSLSSSYEAVLKGIASDGGLYVPETIKEIDLTDLQDKDYCQLAETIISKIFDDININDLKEAIKKAYNRFGDKIIEIKSIDKMHFLELYHGPTAAFKDFALCLLPQIMSLALKNQKVKEELVILTATSGDTGKAALEGFKDIEGIKVIVFYPTKGVSSIQKYQMITQEGNNTYAIGIEGNFDHAQSALKEIFVDASLNEELLDSGYKLSSANSINIGRLVPQIVYYVYTYLELVKENKIAMGDKIDITVPTGNFGNILAAYIAKLMGLPIENLICASNENDVLTDFFGSGEYNANRELVLTNSPSMDIIVSSNLERLLYFISKGNSEEVLRLMNELNGLGKYKINPEMANNLKDFFAYKVDQNKSKELISKMYEENKYLIDTHTAVAYGACLQFLEERKSNNHMIIASTASPYKFPVWVAKALNIEIDENEFKLINRINKITNVEIPKNLENLDKKEITQHMEIERNKIKENIKDILKVGD